MLLTPLKPRTTFICQENPIQKSGKRFSSFTELQKMLSGNVYKSSPTLLFLSYWWWKKADGVLSREKKLLSVVTALTKQLPLLSNTYPPGTFGKMLPFPAVLFSTHRNFPPPKQTGRGKIFILLALVPGKKPQCIIIPGPQAGLENCYQLRIKNIFRIKTTNCLNCWIGYSSSMPQPLAQRSLTRKLWANFTR